MKLEELLEVINDNAIVEIYKDTELVSVNDGKDSIDEQYNEYIVEDVYASENKVCIEIYSDYAG